MERQTTNFESRAVAVVLAAVGCWGAAPAWAIEAGEKEEQKVDTFEAEKKKDRPTVEEREGPEEVETEEFIDEKKFQSEKAADRAIVRLQDLLKSTPEDDPDRAEVLFNLAEAYWDKSKSYEQKAFAKQDQCYAYRDAEKTEKAKRCERRKERMLDESDRLRNEAVSHYKTIIKNYPNFDQLHKILFYLANNLDKAGRKQEAMKVYRKLLSNFPDSQYTPNVLLAIGEYYFQEKENPERALKFYNKVKAYPDSPVYSYALYKAAWSHYNIQQKDKALDIFIDVIEYAENHPNQDNAQALVDQTRNDIVKTYAAVGTPERAMSFFREVTDNQDQVYEMAERLAVQYASDGKYGDSTKMYRQLISERKKTVDTIGYQYEIVRNHTSDNPYRKGSVEELVKLLKLVQIADEGKFDELDEEKYDKERERVEQLVRQWATRFHREGQVTKNPNLYKMAFFLYDNYLTTFRDSDHIYKMTFFDAEILYHLERFEKAAEMYHKVLEIDEEGKYTKDAAHAQVLAYFKVVNTSEERESIEGDLEYEKKDRAEEVKEGESDEEGAEVPEPKEIGELQKKLVDACRTYLEHLPDGDRTVDVKYTMARVFYEHNQYDKALKTFRDIAFNHPEHRLAKVSANLHLNILLEQKDYEQLEEAVAQYRKEKPVDDTKFKSNIDKLNRELRFKECREFESAEQWKKTANCYVEFYRDFPDSKYVDKALYNAALAYERIKELGKAIQVRIFLLKAAEDSKLAPKTVYRIGGNYQALAVYSQSAKFYEKFIDIYPDLDADEKKAMENHEEKAERALAHAATFRQGLGEYETAIENYREYLDLFGDRTDFEKKAADTAFQIAKIYEKQEHPEKAKAQYETYLEEWADKGEEDLRLQAKVQIGLYHWNHDNREEALEKFEETLEAYRELPDEEKEKLTEGRDAAAQAKFMIGEDVNDEMVEITFENADIDPSAEDVEQLKKNEEKMREIFNEKLEVALEAEKVYEEVVKFKRPDWAIAAFYKIGSQYQEFAETLRDSPIPERLTYRQKERYKGMLEDQAMQVEKKAVRNYKRAIGAAKKERWFNEYSRKAEVELSDLRPKQFGEPAELRAEPKHFRSGYTRSGFIDELEEEGEKLEELGGENEAPGTGGESAQKTSEVTGAAGR